MVTEAQVWSWLADVPDPEIPVVSVVDLGIVRGVAVSGEQVKITVTPTYSGCPATAVIALSIETELARKGAAETVVEHQLAPAWTTDWMTETGRAKLRDYGIAPPSASGGPEACPQCGSASLSRVSQFGSTPCKALWRCNDCAEPFDYFKCI